MCETVHRLEFRRHSGEGGAGRLRYLARSPGLSAFETFLGINIFSLATDKLGFLDLQRLDAGSMPRTGHGMRSSSEDRPDGAERGEDADRGAVGTDSRMLVSNIEHLPRQP